MRVYVAGPYTKPYPPYNVRKAIDAAQELADAGHFPYIPHLTMFWDMAYARPYDYWMRLDEEFLKVCEAVVRIPGESSGADQEEKVAKKLGIPVFYSVKEFLEYTSKLPWQERL